jgi:hypothetical protein
MHRNPEILSNGPRNRQKPDERLDPSLSPNNMDTSTCAKVAIPTDLVLPCQTEFHSDGESLGRSRGTSISAFDKSNHIPTAFVRDFGISCSNRRITKIFRGGTFNCDHHYVRRMLKRSIWTPSEETDLIIHSEVGHHSLTRLTKRSAADE